MSDNPIVLASFQGIAPRFDGNTKLGMAVEAENCDLSSTKLKPVKDNLLIEENIDKHNSLFKYQTQWLTGNDKHYVRWALDGYDILLYLEDGVLMKRVGADVSTAGHAHPRVPTIQKISTSFDLGSSAYEWKRSSVSGEAYCVLKDSQYNLLKCECNALTGWTDGDSGVAAASTQTAFDGQETFMFDSGNAAVGNLARRTKDCGSVPNKYRLHVKVYLDAIGLIANNDYFEILVSRTNMRLRVAFTTLGVKIYNDTVWEDTVVECPLDRWLEYTFIVDATDEANATVDIYEGNELLQADVPCATIGNYTNGEVQITQRGNTTANRISYVDFIHVGNNGQITASEPDELKVDGVVSTPGTLGELEDGEWAWGNQDKLGFDTIYYRFSDEEGYEWIASGSGTGEFHLRKRGGNPLLPAELRDLRINGKLYAESEPGSLSTEQYGTGDNDSLGYTTAYVRFPDDLVPDIHDAVIEFIDVVGDSRTVHTRPGAKGNTTTTIKAYVNKGSVSGYQRYMVTTTRVIGGHRNESEPSPFTSEINCDSDCVRVTRYVPADPDTEDKYIRYWTIYRISNATGEALLVKELPYTTLYHDDSEPDANLGIACPSWLTTTHGNEIAFEMPKTGIDGIAKDIYNGMVLYWKGSYLFWCEPGLPDAHPHQYYLNFPRNIKGAVPYGGTVVVLCEDGPWRADISDPEVPALAGPYGSEPCIGTAVLKTSSGVVYPSDSGMVLFNLSAVSVVSDAWFTETWFAKNIDLENAFIAECDGVIYLFHSEGVLYYDPKTSIWRTLPIIAYAAYADPLDGELYFIDAFGINRLFGSEEDLSYKWRSGNLLGRTPLDKEFFYTRVNGAGTTVLSLFVDDILKASKTVDMDALLDRNKELRFPEHTYGKSLQIQLEGTGTVDEVITRYGTQ